MPITTITDSTGELTRHLVTGVVTDDEMFACQTKFYQSPTRLQFWDMSGAELSEVTTSGLRRFVRRAAALGRTRPDGKTAVFVKTKLQLGLARMSEAYAEFESLPFAFRVFENRADALAWLKAGPEET